MEQNPQEETGMWWVLVAASALFVGLTCWPIFAGKGYIYGDLGAFHIPFRTFIHQQMRSGVFPLWNPNSFGGLYLQGEGQAGLFHPFHLIAYALLDPQLEVQLEMTGWYVLLLVGCFALFRRWAVSRSAALLGAIVFTFAGFSRMHLPHVHAMAVLTHLPWMLLCIDHFYRDETGRGRWSIAVSVLNASAILFGYPPFYFFLLLFQAWYVLWFYGEPHWWRQGFKWGAAVLGGVLLGAPQWLPTLSSVGGSSREVASSSFLVTGSWNPLNLLGFANPGLFARGFMGDNLPDEMNLYPGAGVLLLASYLVGHPSLRSKYRRAFRMLVMLATFGLLLSLGRYGKVYELWLRIPIVRSFRVPVRYFCMVQFALAGLSALALDSFLSFKSQRYDCRRQTLPAILLGAGTLFTFGLGWEMSKAAPDGVFARFARTLRADYFSDPREILMGGVLVLLLCTFYTLAVRSNGIWARATIMILLVDLLWYTGSIWLAYPTGTAQDIVAEIYHPGAAPPAVISPPDDVPPHAKEGRRKLYYDIEMSNVYALAGYRTTNGYASLTPRGALPLESEPYKILMGSQSIWRKESGWRTVVDPLPPVRLLTDLVPSMHPSLDISRIDYRRQALVSEPHTVDPAAKGVAQQTEISTQEKRIITDTSGAMLCVLAQRFHPGWKAKSEGNEVALFAVYGDLTGFVAPNGHHVTELKFAPDDLRKALWLAGLGVLLSSLFAALARRAQA